MSASDPFRVDGPAILSVSGGRTSAYMLRRIVQAHGGTLPADVIATFANTGKEMPETLDFVRDLAERWGVAIHWLEYRWRSGEHYFAEVDHATASRNGEPFDLLIEARSMLPNPVARFCTQELKIRTMQRFAWSLGWRDWTNVVGLRADEPRHVANLRARNEGGKDGWDISLPLASAGITRRDVAAFWRAQNFDLRLPNINGATPHGNCDLCFLKSAATIAGIIRDRPELARWWIEKETDHAARPNKQAMSDRGYLQFRMDRPSYAAMLDASQRQENFDFGDLDQRIDCYCGDAAS